MLLNQCYAFARRAAGATLARGFSDIAALPVRLGSAARSRRVFHPIGVLAEGTLERLAPPGEELPMASGTGTFLRLARLMLRHVVPGRNDVAFDPVLHSPPGVQMLPHWLTGFRRTAYRRSREGRDAE